MIFFRIPNLFYEDLDFAPESIRTKKKKQVCILLFRDPGWKNIWIRDEKMIGSGSGVRDKTSGSAALTPHNAIPVLIMN
jgi:hypothetical protein